MRILKLNTRARTCLFPSSGLRRALSSRTPARGERCRTGESRGGGFAIAAISAILALSACASDPQSRQQLDSGEQAFTAHQYDQSIRDADAAIAARDHNAAEANYLRGRAIEEREKPDSASAARDLAMAQSAYETALTQNPTAALSGLLHGQLGNIAYYRGDFATALREFSIAENQLDRPEWKAWVLYRMGICQQCLSRFADADVTFQRVCQYYPDTDPAHRAALRVGVRGFYVQLGAYDQLPDIQKAAAAVSAAGSVPLKTTNKNLTVIRTQDMPSYAQAEQLKSRLAGEYPDAMVMP